jgi:hypothetical protein
MEGESIGHSRGKSYTSKFKPEVVEVAKVKRSRDVGRLCNVGESNKPFKDKLRAKWENWMMVGIHEYSKTGRMERPSYKDIVARIVENWAAVNENCVRNGFIKARGDEAVSGDSDYVHDDTFSEIEEGMKEIPK